MWKGLRRLARLRRGLAAGLALLVIFLAGCTAGPASGPGCAAA